ncbi:CLUMA_CG002270, isoform A [Clunio marinus]|uniref:CLUMA_CG002270, isoform A n=1 Tax=Clunio marinus TaxID=568069 RepID=A0A1J1HLT0_9DIPT|nr:CLUMA_CG002270, isoform A [Clunio marinus]
MGLISFKPIRHKANDPNNVWYIIGGVIIAMLSVGIIIILVAVTIRENAVQFEVSKLRRLSIIVKRHKRCLQALSSNSLNVILLTPKLLIEKNIDIVTNENLIDGRTKCVKFETHAFDEVGN